MSNKPVDGGVRRSYDFDAGLITAVSRYVSERSTSLAPYTMSQFMNEAIRDKLAKHGYSPQPNGTSRAHEGKNTTVRG